MSGIEFLILAACCGGPKSGFQRGVAPLVKGGVNAPHAKPVYFEILQRI
jgi:hypothetical protein